MSASLEIVSKADRCWYFRSMTWAGKQGFQKPIDVDFMVAGKPHGKFVSLLLSKLLSSSTGIS
jgi:hypothetical protein